MNYSLGNMLGGGFVGGLDPDAKGYIDAVVAAGGTVSGTQKNAINTFVKTGKSDGWYSSLKRMYLPIWGVAAPNAIDMIGLTSGTFVGTVTHSAGYAQSNGTTGYFRTGTTFPAEGLSVSDGYMFGLHYTANTTATAVVLGAGNINTAYYFLTLTLATARWCSSASGIGLITNRTGIFSFSRKSGVRTFWRRATSGRSVLGTATNADAGTIPVSPVFAMANNGTDTAATFTPTFYDDGQKGAYGFGLGMTDVQDSAFTAALKTLWEGTTNLILP
jgi:hypothetical protein